MSHRNRFLCDLPDERLNELGRDHLNKMFCRWSRPLEAGEIQRAEELESLAMDCVETVSRAHDARIADLEKTLEADGVRLTGVLYIHNLHNSNGGQVRVQAARELLLKIMLLIDTFGEQRTDCAVVSAAALTPAASATLRPVADPCTMFKEAELVVLAIDHCYSSKHSLLSPAETAEYLAETGNTPEKNALIRSSDPVVRYYGWRAGSVVRILRDYSSLDMPSPMCIAYRTVVSDR